MSKPETAAKESFFTEVLQLKRLWPFIQKDQWVLWVALLVTPDFSLCSGTALFD